jgi:cytochrome c biogenesis protein
MVDVFERLGLFRVFSAWWFVLLLTLLVVSIIVCTLDRLPDLWRQARRVRVVQAAPFFDLRLDHRAAYAEAGTAGADALREVLRGSRFKVREEVSPQTEEGRDILHIYGDRNQYMKLATLFTHLGLILFLAGGAVTTALGYETVVFLGEGQTAPVQAVGTPDNLLVKNIHFEAPTRPDGSFADFRTDLAVYRNGEEVARKIIRVNDPLEVDGYVFHQNTFGPAENLSIWDAGGQLVWDGPVLLDGALAGLPQGFLTIPGSQLGLLVVLNRATDGTALLALSGITAEELPTGGNVCFLQVLGLGATTSPGETCGYTIGWASAGAYTGMVIKRDPGQSFIWIAYLSLIIGLALTFYFPRRRVWARLNGERLELAMSADRYVDVEREFGRLQEELSARLRNRPESRLQPNSTGGRT